MRHRTPKRSQRGQAALLGVVGLMILAIGMYTSYNLARAVYEKIKLQNTADATAYGLATLEARTFNFIAFANRAQVANYVQMMEAQATLSQVTFFEGAAGWNGDFMQATANLLRPAIPFVPGLLAVVTALDVAGKALEQLHGTLRTAIDTLEQMRWSQLYLQLESGRNQALFAVSSIMALATLAQVSSGGQSFVSANDTDARQTPISYALTGLNVASYLQAFDLAGSNTYASTPAAYKARRLMAELANGARIGSGAPNFVVARTPLTFLQNIAATLAQLGDIVSNRPVVVAAQGAVAKAMNQISSPFYVGTSKLMTGGMQLPALDDTGKHEPEHSDLAQGDAIVARDQGTGVFASKRFASLRVMQNDSEHCRYEKPKSGYGQAYRLVPLMLGLDFKCYKPSQDDHRWQPFLGQGGIQPYLGFAADTKHGLPGGASTFNQPDVMVFLNKEPSHMVTMGHVGDLNFAVGESGYGASLDARIGMRQTFAGMNVLARAQVYYHRPGAWQEPPNFFNPYWGARLAPKSDIMAKLGGSLGATGGLAQLFADNIWMH